MELTQQEKELIVVALSATVDDEEQVAIHKDAMKLLEKLHKHWNVPRYR